MLTEFSPCFYFSILLTASITHTTTRSIWRSVSADGSAPGLAHAHGGFFTHFRKSQSDYDVCTFCGSLSECPHDTEQATENREDVAVSALQADAADPDNTCEMVANAPVAPGAEIFNTYGASLGNAEL